MLTLYVVMLCISLSFGNNLNEIAGVLLPGGIYVFPLTFIVCDVICDVYGLEEAKKFVWLGILAQLTYVLFAQLFLLMPTPEEFDNSLSYHTVFDPTFRFLFAALAGFFCGEFLNIYVLHKLRIRFSGRYFMLRSAFTTAIGQALLSIIVDTIAYSSTIDNDALIKMIISTWSLKMLYSLLFVAPAWVLVQYLKKVEPVEAYDGNIDYNPLKP